MKCTIYLLAILTGFFCTTSFAQTLTDSNYRTVGYIKSDGTIQDASYRTIGHIKSDGTVQDASYRTVGYVKDDGTIQDASYRTIGHAKDLPKAWAAFFFFFREK